MNNPTYGSLFAGVGGFDLGFDSAGWECKFQVEWDKKCQEVLKRHWPNVPKHGDVKDVNGALLPPVDLISFGSPCQDLSQAGRQVGLSGERSGLFFEAIRIIKEMRDATNGEYPKWAIWENVPGALTSNNGEDFAEVINQMANLGPLGIEWHVLDAQWFGVPQRRRRVFLIACWDNAAIGRSSGKILSVPEDNKGNIRKIRKKGKHSSRTVKDGIGEVIWYGNAGHAKWREGGITLAASDYKRPERNFLLEPFVKTRRAQSREDFEKWVSEDTAPTLNAFDNSSEVRSTVLIVDGKEVDYVLRRLTPIECERLMGFPDNHTQLESSGKLIADSNRYKMCGNAIASPVAEWIGKEIKKWI